MVNKIRNYGGKEGYCNICDEYKKLTFDHVPPKGCVGIKNRNVAPLIAALNCKKLNKDNTRQFQDGLKFKSLCEVCNNELLGLEYDPYLKEFAAKISNYTNLIIKQGISLPTINIEIKLQRVVRSVVGHLLAAQVREDMTTPITHAPYMDALRQYFLNPLAPIPKELAIYYWVYPSDIQVIILGSGLMRINSKEVIVGEFLKFYPIAFWVIWDQPQININLHSLSKNRALSIDDLSPVIISIENIPRVDWPEQPGNDKMVLLNDEVAYIATKKEIKRKPTIAVNQSTDGEGGSLDGRDISFSRDFHQ